MCNVRSRPSSPGCRFGRSLLESSRIIAFLGGGLLLYAATGVQAQDAPEVGLGLADVVQVTLEHNVSIRMQEAQLRYDEGNLLSAAGHFDPQLRASVTSGREETPFTRAQRDATGTSLARNDITTYRLGVNKQFRSGFSVNPGVEVSRNEALGIDAAPVIQTRASLLIQAPLLRGRGANLNAAQVTAAETALDAAELTLRHTTAQGLVQAVFAYWSYLSADRTLDILTTSEARAQRLLTETETLVEAGERPTADLDQLRANLADKVTARINAEQAHFEARQALGLAMGLSFEHIALIPPPGEDFPAASGVPQALPPEADLTRLALARRADLQSAHKHEEAARTLLRAAHNETRPRVDLQFDVGYSGLSEGGTFGEYLPPVGQNDEGGINAFVSLIYSLPTGNRSARGFREQQEALFHQRLLAAADLQRQVSSGVAVAKEALQRSLIELSKAREAVLLYRKSVENEKKKLRLSMATLFDVILVEDRLTNALLSEVAAQVRYAQALARLRFETGSVPLGDNAHLEDQVRALTTLPQP